MTEIELPVDNIIDSIHRRGWASGTWTDEKTGAGCLHQHIRWCQPQPGDAFVVQQVANRQGWGPDWNDAEDRTVDDLKPVLVDHRDITDRDLEDTFGPQWEAIVALVRRAATLTEDEAERLAAAGDAAGDAAGAAAGAAARAAAWDAAGVAARDAARDAARVAAGDAAWDAARVAAGDAAWDAAGVAARDAARVAAWALTVRDLIGQHGFQQHHYDTLTRPWATVIGPAHPDDKDRQ